VLKKKKKIEMFKAPVIAMTCLRRMRKIEFLLLFAVVSLQNC